MQDKILIIDFGSQFTQLIARRIRESHNYCEVHPYHKINSALLNQLQPKGIILSGGPDSVTQNTAYAIPDKVFEYGCPILGICYGEQLMCRQLGGIVSTSQRHEYGKAHLNIIGESPLLHDIASDNLQVWMSHADKVQSLPDGFSAIATSDNAPFAAIQHKSKNFYGVQFHPEVTHTLIGQKLLNNFTNRICGMQGNWNMHSFSQAAIDDIRHQVGDSHAICALSGGVDSAVTAALIHQAITENLTCIFVDTGLMRSHEGEQIKQIFLSHYNIPLIAYDGEAEFLAALKGVEDPEQKRKIIGKLFIDIFENLADKLPVNAEFLAQGTLYPDVIESISPLGGPSVTIKSHHNVGGLPEHMQLKLLEPLRMLFKDEVRALGIELGLPRELIGRHPFPGPGLAVRILGEVTKERCDILRQADKIYIEELRRNDLYDKIWQAFAVLLPIKSVGVMGDNRTYDNVCALRAVTSSDGMTAESFEFPPYFLARVATRIVNEVSGINRVVYDCTSKPPATIEWE